MTLHRYLYTLCWRNKVFIAPILILVSLITFLAFSASKHGEDGRNMDQPHFPHDHVNIVKRGDHLPKRPGVAASAGKKSQQMMVAVDHHDHKHRRGPPVDLQHKFVAGADSPFNREPIAVPAERPRIEAPEKHEEAEVGQDNNKPRILGGHARGEHDHFDIEDNKLVPHNHEHPLPADGIGHNNVEKEHQIHRTFRPHKGVEKFVPTHRKRLFHDVRRPPYEFKMWQREKTLMCDDKFVAYNNEYAILHDVILDLDMSHGRRGGEEIADVLNQAEEAEYYEFEPGFFKMSCPSRPAYFFNNNNHLMKWINSLTTYDYNTGARPQINKQFTVAITRYEYANLYHTMTDFYNAFLMMEFFNKTQKETNILLIDGHPKGALDPTWSVLFNSSTRISALPRRTKFTNLVWSVLGYNSRMMDHMAPTLPLTNEFRDFFLQSYNIKETHKLNCDKISVLFIWRRDYLAHPRNPAGKLTRKIANEHELVDTLRESFPSYNVKGIQIDLFDMQQQLQLIADSDVLIGMHGAGLTHALFLPKHAGLLEILPTYWSEANEHFRALATWRKLLYERWVNRDPNNESDDHFTTVPIEVVNVLTKRLVYQMCTGEKLLPRDDEYEVGTFKPWKKTDSR